MLGLILLVVYLNKVTLLGNSLGGAVALGYALAYPNEVGRLILMAPGGVEDLQTYLDMPGIANMFKIYQSVKLVRKRCAALCLCSCLIQVF